MSHESAITDVSAADILDGAKGHGKISCPKCGQKSFSATRDGGFGQCWRPTCGYRLHRRRDDDLCIQAFLHLALVGIFELFRKTLLEDATGREARDYLNSRKVVPFVWQHAALGAVPANFDPAPYFVEPLRLAQERASKLKEQAAKPKGRRKQKAEHAVESAEYAVQVLGEAPDKLRRCCWAGHLVFFCADELRRYVGMRFRRPGTKDITSYQPLKRHGVFGFELWTHDVINSTRVIVQEGEFNVLSLQSALVRNAVLNGREPERGLVCCVAVGSCTNVDVTTLARIAKSPPIVLYDNDESGAGLTLVEQLTAVRDCEAVCTESPHKDIDELIRACGDDVPGAVAAVRRLLQRRKLVAFRAPEAIDDPHRLARTFLNQHCRCDGYLALRFYQAEFIT